MLVTSRLGWRIDRRVPRLTPWGKPSPQVEPPFHPSPPQPATLAGCKLGRVGRMMERGLARMEFACMGRPPCMPLQLGA